MSLLPRISFAIAALGLLGGLNACTVNQIDSDDDDGSGGSGEGGSGGTTTQPQGLPLLGNYAHTPDSVDMATITSAADNLANPRDLQFHPSRPNELWVVNRTTNSVTICTDPGMPSQTTATPTGLGADHFLREPSSIAFGANGFFATIHETDDQTQGFNGTPADFMGPTLWTDNLAEYEGGHASHYDMLHNSPNGMGIAWQPPTAERPSDNVYWVFDGYHSSVTMYDFNADHGPGGSDHSDAIVRRHGEGQFTWVENVPSHMAFHPANPNLLYIADTGNSRIAVLDTSTGTDGANIFPNYDGTDQKAATGSVITTLVDASVANLTHPSGLAIHNDIIYVTDAANSVIWAFTLEGELVDWLETGLPAYTIFGLDLDTNGHLYIADGVSNAVWRIRPLQ